MPLYRRLPKRGFNSIKINKIAKINLDKIQNLITSKKIKPEETINLNLLIKNKLINKKFTKIKILGKGELKTNIKIEADYISKQAMKKIEKNGNPITLKNKK